MDSPGKQPAPIDVEHVAHLARIRLGAESAAQLQADMDSILRMVDVLVRADVDQDLAPMAHPLGIAQRMREDSASDPRCPEILEGAPEAAPDAGGAVFLVPKVLDSPG